MEDSLEARLGLNVYQVDSESHIRIDQERCRTECRLKPCTFVCPARVYRLADDGSIHVEHDGCLECGTCIIACPAGVLSWHYPRAGYGVQYRFG